MWSSVEMKDGNIFLDDVFLDAVMVLSVGWRECDSSYFFIPGHNQGFNLMSSLVASRHNDPLSRQDPSVSVNSLFFILAVSNYVHMYHSLITYMHRFGELMQSCNVISGVAPQFTRRESSF